MKFITKSYFKKCLCELKDLIGAQEDKDEQQLSISGDTISLTNGGSVDITHPTPPVPALTKTTCAGPFMDQTNRTGWLQTWTPIVTANTGTITSDWIQVSTTETSPACATDVHVSVDFGTLYYQMRAFRLYHWVDWRLLVNGAAVINETYDEYNYDTTRTGDGELLPLDVNSDSMGHSNAVRYNVPAGATLAVEVRYRHNFNAAQTNAWGRYIAGLRSQATFMYHFRTELTDVTIS